MWINLQKNARSGPNFFVARVSFQSNKNDSNQSFFIFMRALPIALTLGLLFGGLAERGPIAHAQSVDVTTIKDELSPGEFRAYGESSPMKLKSRLGELTFTKGGFAGAYPPSILLRMSSIFKSNTGVHLGRSDCQLCPMA